MPGKSTKDKRSPWEVDFVYCELDKSDKEALKKWDVTCEQSMSVVERLVSDGFKLTVWRDNAHDCFGCSVTSPKRDDGARQKVLSGRGPEFMDAIRSVAYKHSVLLEGEWGDRGEWQAGRDNWG